MRKGQRTDADLMSSASARLSRANPGGWARIRQHKWAKIHGHSQRAAWCMGAVWMRACIADGKVTECNIVTVTFFCFYTEISVADHHRRPATQGHILCENLFVGSIRQLVRCRLQLSVEL